MMKLENIITFMIRVCIILIILTSFIVVKGNLNNGHIYIGNNYQSLYKTAIFNYVDDNESCLTLKNNVANLYSFINCTSPRTLNQRFMIEKSATSITTYRIINDEFFHFLKRGIEIEVEIVKVNRNGGVNIKVYNQNLCLTNKVSDNTISPYTVNENQFFQTCLTNIENSDFGNNSNNNPMQVFYFTKSEFPDSRNYIVNIAFTFNSIDYPASSDEISWLLTNDYSLSSIRIYNDDDNELKISRITSNSFRITSFMCNSQCNINVDPPFYLRNTSILEIQNYRGLIPIKLEYPYTRIYNKQGNCRFCKTFSSPSYSYKDCMTSFDYSQMYKIYKPDPNQQLYRIEMFNDSFINLEYLGNQNFFIESSGNGNGYAIKTFDQNKCLSNNLGDVLISPYLVDETQYFKTCNTLGTDSSQIFYFYPNNFEPYNESNVNSYEIRIYFKFDNLDTYVDNREIDYMNSVYPYLRIRISYYLNGDFSDFVISSSKFTINFKQCFNGCSIASNSIFIENSKFTLVPRISIIDPQNFNANRCTLNNTIIFDFVNTTKLTVYNGNTYLNLYYSNNFESGPNPWYPNANNLSNGFVSKFTKIRINISNDQVYADDKTFGAFTGSYMNLLEFQYGYTASCGGSNGTGIIDLRSTSYRIKANHGIIPWGANPWGSITLSNQNQVGNLSYNGSCGAVEYPNVGGGWSNWIEKIP